MPICKDIIKQRVIHFQSDAPEVAKRASELLSAVPGVSRARVTDGNSIRIHYDVRELTLQMIEQALEDIGFNLSDNVICKIKRGLIAYCEEALRESLGVTTADSNTPSLSLPTPHAHDPRPYQWRNYT